MNRAEEFEQLRPLLFSIAYRILGSVSEAEDAVQETWLRYSRTPSEPDSARNFLSTTVSRIAIDVLPGALQGPARRRSGRNGKRHPRGLV